MISPIFAVEGGDVHMFMTKEDAEAYLEVVDVNDGVYHVYDATGTGVSVRVHGNRVELGETANRNGSAQLMRAIQTYLLAVPQGRRLLTDADIPQATLKRLVDEMVHVERRTGSGGYHASGA